MSVREDRSRATALAILDAARIEFEAMGFAGANLRAIATRAGVSAGSVVHHFGGKRGLLHAAFFEDLQAVLSRAFARSGKGPLEAQLGRLTKAIFGYYAARPRLSRTLLAESLFAEPPWAERFRGQVESVHQHVAALGAEAIARGELAARATPSVMAASYLSFFYFALIGWAQGGVSDPGTMVRTLMKQHLDGLRAR